MIFYYSGCGNSRHTAEVLAGKLGEKLIFIPEAEKLQDHEFVLGKDEMIGFVWPIYCWAPPQLVLDFVSKLKFIGRPSHVYFVATCGDTTGDSEKVFRKALKKIGLSLDACYSVIMPETYVNIKGMNLDTPERAKSKIEEADKELPEISVSIRNHDHVSRMTVGSSPWLKTYIVKPLFYRILVNDKRFHVTDACIGCGRCSKVCPLGNVSMVNGRPQWNGHCTTCNACYHNCPVNAIQFGKATEGKGQYVFPEK